MQLRRITERRLHAYRRLSSEVIVAVPWLPDEAGAADDDVCFERVTGAVDGVGDVAGPLACCWVAGGGGLVWVLSVGWRRGMRGNWRSGGRGHTNLGQ